MFKFRYLFVFAAALFWNINAEAKVCFLVNADGSENCSEAGFEGYAGETSCVGMGCQYCTLPRSGKSPCLEGQNCYKPENCCSNPQSGGGGVDCPEPKECQTIKGVHVDGCPTGDTVICPTDAVCRCPFIYISRTDYNRLPASKRSGLEACDSPKELSGESCDNGDGVLRHEFCSCPSEYNECQDPLVGVGESCKDGNDLKYTSCACPSKYNLTAPADCSYCTTCEVNDQTFYSCTLNNPPTCKCSVRKDSNGCSVDCDDDVPEDYDYIGKALSNVSFSYQTDALQGDEICARQPCCAETYWDKTEYCDTNTCTALGYTDTSCSGAFVGCPCDVTKKKCL